MHRTKTELEDEISKYIRKFLYGQLGEETGSVNTYVNRNTLMVQITECLSPGEMSLAQTEAGFELLQKVKIREFEKVKPLLERFVWDVTGCAVKNIYSTFERDGVRIQMIVLNDDLEETL